MGLRAERDGPDHVLILGHPFGPIREHFPTHIWSELLAGQYAELSPSRELGKEEDEERLDVDLESSEFQDMSPEEARQRVRELREKEAPRFGICRHVYLERTIEELQAETQIARAEWERTEVCATLVSLLRCNKAKMGKSLKRVTNVVAMGIGSMHEFNGEAMISRARVQFSALLTILETLGEPGKPLPCVIQDPAYSKRDHEYLRTIGFESVYDPDAFGCINSETLVFSIGTYYRMFWEMSQGPQPAAFVCEDFVGWTADLGCTYTYDEDDNAIETPIIAPRLWVESIDNMFRDCTVTPFTNKDRMDKMWESVLLHWRIGGNQEDFQQNETEGADVENGWTMVAFKDGENDQKQVQVTEDEHTPQAIAIAAL